MFKEGMHRTREVFHTKQVFISGQEQSNGCNLP